MDASQSVMKAAKIGTGHAAIHADSLDGGLTPAETEVPRLDRAGSAGSCVEPDGSIGAA